MDEGPSPLLAPSGHEPEDETVANAGNGAGMDHAEFRGVDPGGKSVGYSKRGGLFEQSPR
jgi:hypothetical protein